MGYYRNQESPNDMFFDDIENMLRDPPEVTDGLFSRCVKKSEENKKTCGCAPKEQKKEEKKENCGCKEKSEKATKMSSPSRGRRSKRAVNAFILFYLEMYKKSSGKHVTCVAIQAGKKWSKLSDKEKEKYVQMAKARRDKKL
ncbi:high mobility group protein B3-like [Belonocnema kinseyi]|uniref:high mobility group protein B3-like n=1 Tax=Belonocnema kinseyi TaxID=2817044 RepID=UPI00143CF093|nr:high mobility group protein B3-like [Belonocnema kinseyi]